MPGFRVKRLGIRPGTVNHWNLDDVCRIIADVMRPGHFFVAPPLELVWEHAAREVIPWELFHGRLLDRAQTREQHTFEAWNIFLINDGQRSSEPLLAVKLDCETGQVFVVRAIHCYAWEGYDDGNNVFLSRETQKWVRELTGRLCVHSFTDFGALQDELICLLFHAVVGTSRLPLTSIEAPLPAFSLGQLAYCFRRELSAEQALAPLNTAETLIERALQLDLTELEHTKLLEILLRRSLASRGREAPEDLAASFAARWRRLDRNSRTLPALLRQLFDDVALSPSTRFVDTALQFLRKLEKQGHIGSADAIDFLSYLLRHVCRHLTAYDLITFHHQGANYPDALLLDAALKDYLERIERDFDLFSDALTDNPATSNLKRIRRRALRQAWMMRRFYEGLLVPDAPTSPGENARVLPVPYVRVPEEQIVVQEKRTKRLFDADPLPPYLGTHGQGVLRQSLSDLNHEAELLELGLALFLDRPLGFSKAPTDPVQTLLISYEAFSRTIASRRIRYLANELGLLTPADRDNLLAKLRALPKTGVPLPLTRGIARPGAVSLDDARKVAPDFHFLRTTRRSLQDLFEQFNFAILAQRLGQDVISPERRILFIRDEDPEQLAIYDADGNRRVQLRVRTDQGFLNRGGQEYPAAGLEAFVGAETVSIPLKT